MEKYVRYPKEAENGNNDPFVKETKSFNKLESMEEVVIKKAIKNKEKHSTTTTTTNNKGPVEPLFGVSTCSITESGSTLDKNKHTPKDMENRRFIPADFIENDGSISDEIGAVFSSFIMDINKNPLAFVISFLIKSYILYFINMKSSFIINCIKNVFMIFAFIIFNYFFIFYVNIIFN